MATEKNDDYFMKKALEQAKRSEKEGEVPVGAVIVFEGKIVSRGRNKRETSKSSLHHAEIEAISKACKKLGRWRLTGCTVYVTLEPCLMCAGLMHQARIDRCVYGASDPKAGALGTLYQINADERLNHTFEVTPGVLADECAEELRAFFAARRKK